MKLNLKGFCENCNSHYGIQILYRTRKLNKSQEQKADT